MNKNNGFIFGLGLAALLSTSAFAEEPVVAPAPAVQADKREIHQLNQEIRKETHEVRQDRRQLRKDRHTGAPEAQVQADRAKLQQDKQERHELVLKKAKERQERRQRK